METTLPGMRKEGKGCQRKNLEAACACVRACVCVSCVGVMVIRPHGEAANK